MFQPDPSSHGTYEELFGLYERLYTSLTGAFDDIDESAGGPGTSGAAGASADDEDDQTGDVLRVRISAAVAMGAPVHGLNR